MNVRRKAVYIQENQAGRFLKMRFTIEGLKHFENMIHPHVIFLKRHYFKNGMYVFPTYHGCGDKNKDGSNRQIDYKRGGHCLFPTFKKYGKKKQKKKLKKNFTIRGICQILI